MKTVLQSERTLTSTPCWCASCTTENTCQMAAHGTHAGRMVPQQDAPFMHTEAVSQGCSDMDMTTAAQGMPALMLLLVHSHFMK